jgi:flagellin-like protein
VHILARSSSKRPGISDVITVLLLIVITVAAAVILYSFARGLLPNLSTGGPSSLVTGGGQMTIPGSTGVSGILTLNLRNEGSKPISSISVTCASPPFSTPNCSTPSLMLLYQGSAVSAANPLSINALASGTAGVTAATTFTAGTSYAIILTIVFVGGSTQTAVLTVTSTS